MTNSVPGLQAPILVRSRANPAGEATPADRGVRGLRTADHGAALRLPPIFEITLPDWQEIVPRTAGSDRGSPVTWPHPTVLARMARACLRCDVRSRTRNCDRMGFRLRQTTECNLAETTTQRTPFGIVFAALHWSLDTRPALASRTGLRRSPSAFSPSPRVLLTQRCSFATSLPRKTHPPSVPTHGVQCAKAQAQRSWMHWIAAGRRCPSHSLAQLTPSHCAIGWPGCQVRRHIYHLGQPGIEVLTKLWRKAPMSGAESESPPKGS